MKMLTHILHTSGVQFRGPFTFRTVPLRNGEREKSRNSNDFAGSAKGVSYLDLGRFTKVIPAFFLKSLHRLKVGACSLLKMALHGFCTTFSQSTSLTSVSGIFPPTSFLGRL